MSETIKSTSTTFERFTARASIFSLAASALTAVLGYETGSNLFLNGGILFGLGRATPKVIGRTSSQLTNAFSLK